ncbi:transcriptional regulator, GntR family [Paludibacter propionicigenes WB4]|uniref:Transcriptional regulator, GntR family n=1 Tax=Paludibacter propionicigenes (strain DSM 17365 / JCM 13257 / WB4) TaxID=694427 RepID=E4T3A9_PALPW|nr:GntR family transcriptional regulator [Paludibacter propionicigenes]ADQ79203.1 transcriptional regulator, GntR family [Paludibacter propionicigenes WB4]
MEFKETQAIYLQIGDYICEQILLSRWKEGDRIPSVRELGVDLQVNPNTVMRTFDFLQNNDIIFNKRGVGYFVAEQANEKIIKYRRNQFMDHELPVFFKNITLLNMNFDDLKVQYNEYIKNNQ